MRRKISVFVLLAALCATTSHARIPDSFRELEREQKAEQARAFQRQLLAADFAAAPSVSVEAYRFDVALVTAELKVKGTVAIDLTAQDAIEAIDLDAIGIVASKVWFTDASGQTSEARFSVGANALTVSFPKRVAAGARFSITVAYSAEGDRLEADRAEKHSNAHGLFFSDSAIYTSTEPQLSRTWFPCIDDPAQKAKRVEMRVTVPPGFYAVSNGALKSIEGNTYTWTESFPMPTYLISIAAAPYKIIEDRWHETPVRYYVPEKLEAVARTEFARTPQMIDHFSALWMPYPFEKYSMAVVPFYGGAMEHTTATTFSDASMGSGPETESIVAHELAHHWWGDTVTTATWDDLWLNEGFASYAEVLFEERFNSVKKSLEYLLWDQAGYFAYDSKAKQAVVDPALSPAEKFSPAVYEKGAWTLHMLRKQLGDAAFFDGMRVYVKRHAFGNATTADFRKALEDSSGRNLADFFKQWVYGKGYPDLKASWVYHRETKQIEVRIVQAQTTPFVLPLDLRIAGVDASGKRIDTIARAELSRSDDKFMFTLPKDVVEPKGILLDPETRWLIRSTVAREPSEVRFWMESAEWMERVQAATSLLHERASGAQVLELLNRFHVESEVIVREAILSVLAENDEVLKGVLTPAVQRKAEQVVLGGLFDSSEDVRAVAAGVAEPYLAKSYGDVLAARFKNEPSARVRRRLASALAASKHVKAFDLLSEELRKSLDVAAYRRYAMALISALGVLGDERATGQLTEISNGPNPYFRRPARESLRMISGASSKRD